MTTSTLLLYYTKTNRDNKKEFKQKCLGNYKLNNLDGNVCDSCELTLFKDDTYEIIVKNKVIGHGHWDIAFDNEGSGYYLVIENGPRSMIFEQERLVEYVDRRQK